MEKLLDIDQYGVQELDATEIIRVNGGGKRSWILVLLEAVPDYLKGLGEGYKWAEKHLKN